MFDCPHIYLWKFYAKKKGSGQTYVPSPCSEDEPLTQRLVLARANKNTRMPQVRGLGSQAFQEWCAWLNPWAQEQNCSWKTSALNLNINLKIWFKSLALFTTRMCWCTCANIGSSECIICETKKITLALFGDRLTNPNKLAIGFDKKLLPHFLFSIESIWHRIANHLFTFNELHSNHGEMKQTTCHTHFE